jgi:hypothetical protein
LRLTPDAFILPVLLLGPWLNILARHGLFALVVLAYMFSMLGFLNSKSFSRRHYVDQRSYILLLLIMLSIVMSFSYHVFVQGLGYQQGGFLIFSKFYSTIFLFMFFWLIVYLSGIDLRKKLNFLTKYFFWVSFLNILWGGVVIYFELPRSWEILHHPDYADGSGRPFGLTGNAAVNGTVLVLLYLMLARNKEKEGGILSIKWFLILAIGIIIQKSGTGLIALFIAGMYQLKQYSPKLLYLLMILFPIVYFLVYLLPESELFYRISPRYIVYNISYYVGNVYAFSNMEVTFMDILFGKAVSLGEKVFTTDFGPLFIFNQMGLLFFLFVSLFLLRIAMHSNLKADKYIIFIVFLAGVHYQALFFLSSSFLFSLYAIHVITTRKNYNRVLPH